MLRETTTLGALGAPVLAVPADVLSTTFQVGRFDPALGFAVAAQIVFVGRIQSDFWLMASNPTLPTQPMGQASMLTQVVFSSAPGAPGFETTPLGI